MTWCVGAPPPPLCSCPVHAPAMPLVSGCEGCNESSSASTIIARLKVHNLRTDGAVDTADGSELTL